MHNSSKRNYIVVFHGDIAKTLFHEGYPLVDFGANKTNPIATAFIFKNILGLEQRINELENLKSKTVHQRR